MGWTWEYVDEFMTIPRFMEMTSYWKENPPTHILVAAYMGVGTGGKQPAKTEGFSSFVADFIKAGGVVKGFDVTGG